MKLFALIAAVLVTVNASTDKDQWVAFKQTHGKTYKSLLEERTRFGIFQNNLRTIEKHNAKYEKGEETYYMGVNRFADMTVEEFKHMLGLQAEARPNLNATLHVFPEELEAPKFVDWTQEGADLGVKDQGHCGSCWAFSVQTHGKTYKSLLEERTRFGIFQNNLRTIEEHNAKYDKGEETYYMGVNQFADMTAEEFRHMLGLQNGARPNLNATLHVFSENLQAPESIDWTQKGADLGVKDQGKCGSCWAFSSTGSLEGQNAIHHKVKTPLSEQQLLDCSSSYGNGDCDEGGLMTNAFKYIKAKGIEAGSSYPYQGRVGSCRYNAQKTILRIKGFKELRASEVELKKAVGTIGPISVAVSSEHLRLYGGGVITTRCIKDLDHAVLAVGYGSENGRKYWKIRNSWGKTWGDHGYFKLARDAGNLCGVASMASYPLL